MPVLHVGRNLDDRAGHEAHSRLSFFLVPAFAGSADKNLPAAFAGMMHMPVVAAAGLERHIGKMHAAPGRQRIQIGLPDKIFRVGGVLRSSAKDVHAVKRGGILYFHD